MIRSSRVFSRLAAVCASLIFLAGGVACAADRPAVGSQPPDFTLSKLGGGKIALSELLGKKKIVLVFGRGYPHFPGAQARYLCPFAQVQAAELAHEYAKIKESGAEVVYVFPNSEDEASEFVGKVKDVYRRKYNSDLESLDFPIAVDSEKTATKLYGLEGDDAVPATFVIDKSGKIAFSYVAKENQPNDLPKIEKIVEVLEGLT
jgi:peroxiredoxin